MPKLFLKNRKYKELPQNTNKKCKKSEVFKKKIKWDKLKTRLKH
jgi:hypothetical protein